MTDGAKTREQLMNELGELRHRIVELEALQMERGRSEDETRKRQEYLEAVLREAPDAIVTLDASHRILEWNPGAERIFGYTRYEAAGKNLDDLVTQPDVADEARAATRKVLSGENLFPFETIRYRRDGTPVNVIAAGSSIEIEGELYGVVAVYTDITERKRVEEQQRKLEAQLLHAQRMEAIGTLAGGIAHNFNNLLMGIQGNVSLMLSNTDPTDPNHKMLDNIEKSVRSGSELAKQLLGYARGGKYELKSTHLNRLVQETAETFSTTRKEVKVQLKLAEDLVEITADQGQIEQVLLNLFINAADAMPEGGVLFLETMNVTHEDIDCNHCKPKPGSYVSLTVRDTGLGMEKETMGHIFDPFFTTKGLGKGTGLGLASVYGILKAHDGYIDVSSEKGHGTAFHVYLPASGRVGIKRAGELPVTMLKGMETVLLVDDEDMVLEVGEQMLKRLGYNVLPAGSGREAIEIFSEAHGSLSAPGLVILDMIMPGMGGSEVYDRLKKIDPEIKVLLSSGYSIAGKATEILEKGCNGFIQKPFNIKELSEKIRTILDN